MLNDKIMLCCDLCNKEYQFGSHRYDGKRIPRYDIMVCKTCYDGNWDGWNSKHEDFLLARLNERGLPIPARNEKGWLPRD